MIRKQMLTENKETFMGCMESDKATATNTLSTKLKVREELGILLKTEGADNGKTKRYFLTNKMLVLRLILIELALWSDGHLRNIHPTIQNRKGMELLSSFCKLVRAK